MNQADVTKLVLTCMKKKGWTEEDLANAVNIGGRDLEECLYGHAPMNIKTLSNIGHALDVELEIRVKPTSILDHIKRAIRVN